MTNKAEFERLLDVYGFRCERFGQDLSTHARAQVVAAFAALASAPATDETHTDEKGTVWTRPTAGAYAQVCKARDKWQAAASLSKPAPVWNDDYKHDVSMLQPKAQASAPVAGEAEIMAIVREQCPDFDAAHEGPSEDDMISIARTLLSRYAAPQASDVDDAHKPKEQS